jgi:membrane protease subunit HflC
VRTVQKRIALIGALAGILVISSCCFTVAQAETAIVTRFGRPLAGVAGPGLHFKLPWPIDSVVRLDSRLLVFDNPPTEMLTADKKNVLIESFLCWRISNPLLFTQTARTRAEAEARLLDLLSSELGAAVGRAPMDSFINIDPRKVTLRALAARTARAVDRLASQSFGIQVVDLEISGFNLPAQNRNSVIERMRAERSRIATQYRSEGEERAMKIQALATTEREKILADARAEAEILRGHGEAEALRVFASAYAKDPEFYRFLRDLESYEKILDNNTTIFLQSDSKLLRALDEK